MTASSRKTGPGRKILAKEFGWNYPKDAVIAGVSWTRFTMICTPEAIDPLNELLGNLAEEIDVYPFRRLMRLEELQDLMLVSTKIYLILRYLLEVGF